MGDPFDELRGLSQEEQEELAGAVGLWRRILDSGQLAVEEPGERLMQDALDRTAEELRDVGFDPEQVLRDAGLDR